MKEKKIKKLSDEIFKKKLSLTETDELLSAICSELADISDSLVQVVQTNIDMRMYIANQNIKLDEIKKKLLDWNNEKI